MKILKQLMLSTLVTAVQSTPFTTHNRNSPFGIPRGGKTSPTVQAFDDDYERAEKQIFGAIGNLEHNVAKVMEKEVDTLFHEMDHHDKAAVKKKAQKAVKRGVKRVKTDIGIKKMSTLPEDYHYPYALDDPDHRLLHAIEHAEKAVLHAVENEVNGLFHELDHHEEHHEHKKALAKGVAKANKHLDDAHESRRSWFMTNRENEGGVIEDYEHYLWALQE
ncbi:unnamed protein product [Cylindrotheca closterium]|uniref:Uncharacterized protein n=1 Tax=Cylindrotheca closterium TaxID=2856 RepID=A0AAD2JLU5_9STRA|nr:unnamed protein product [Cylindrotheca closterium]